MSAIHTMAPQEANTTSNPVRSAGGLSTSDCTKLPGTPVSAESARAAATASPEKSSPVTSAPIRASDNVSSPKWHCRCSSFWAFTSPIPSRTMGSRMLLPALNAAVR